MVLAITTAPTSDLRILSQRARPRSTEPMNDNDPPSDNLALTTEIVAAYVANHAIAPADLPHLITTVFRSLGDAGRVEEAAPEKPARPEPAVPVRKSVQREFIVCLEDGKKVKTLKRYLATRYKLTPDEYRRRWGLPTTTRWWRRLRRAPLDDGQAVRPGPQAGGGRGAGAVPSRARARVGGRAAPAQQRRPGGRRKAAA
jgi:predicted transcriptional regulator